MAKDTKTETRKQPKSMGRTRRHAQGGKQHPLGSGRYDTGVRPEELWGRCTSARSDKNAKRVAP